MAKDYNEKMVGNLISELYNLKMRGLIKESTFEKYKEWLKELIIWTMTIEDIKNEIERRLDEAHKQMRQQHDCHDESFINGKINAFEGIRKFLIKN